MHRIKPLKITVLALCCFACSNYDSNTIKELTLSKTNEHIHLKLDNETGKRNLYSFYSDSLNTYSFYNELNHSIYTYHLTPTSTHQKIPLSKDGPNGIPSVEALYLKDTTYTYVYSQNSGILYMVNPKGHVVSKHTISDPRKGDHVLASQSQIYFKQNSFYFLVRPTTNSSMDSGFNAIKLDLKSGQSTYVFQDKDKMKNGIWGGMLRRNHGTFTHDNGAFAIGYPWSENIIVATEKGIIKNHHASVPRVIKPTPSQKNVSSARNRDYLMEQCWFGAIVYDKYRNCYYRSVYIGADLQSGKTPSGSFNRTVNGDDIFTTTIVLDHNFRVIGEIPGTAITDTSIIRKDGIYLYDPRINQENEDVMTFTKHTPTYSLQ